MTDDRFISMFSLWTILSFNILLVGDFDRLNSFVMSTYHPHWSIAYAATASESEYKNRAF